MTETFKKAGDDPCCPYVVLTSFTGAASANIGGQTLHSLFGFKFGTTFLSMTERQRAQKRLLFRNLRCVIIDEISMVDDVFGGVSVFVFGDLYQLQPVKARYVFEPPTNKEHALAHTLRDLWKLFTVINLEENHRQGEDKIYGDLLNRVRTGDHTEEDIALLQTRVVPKSTVSEGTAISSEQETSDKSTLGPNAEDSNSQDEHPNTPSPRHYYPDDYSSLQIPISAETSNLQQSFPEDPSSQDHHPRTPSPRYFLPDDLCSQDQHPKTPSPRHYYPEDVLPLRNVISAEQPTLQQPSKPLPPHLPRKKSANPKTVTYVKMESPEEYKQNIRKRIDEVLKIASAGGTPITYKMYEQAVIEQPRKGSEVLLQRDIDEIFINNYNAEWIINWDANIDISPVYDYYGTITYITDYFTKDSTGLTEVLKTAMRQLGDDKDMRQKCNEMANQFMTHRQVGESEAIYKLLANMKMTYSSIATIFVPTEPKGQRRQFLQRQDPDSGQGFEVEDKKGRFLEKPDLISKYERRKLLPSLETGEEVPEDNEEAEKLEQLSFCQFVKMYEGKGWQDMRKTNEEGEKEEPDDDEEKPEEGELAQEDDFNYLIVGNSDARQRKLPQLLTLADVMPGEPRILHKRTFPRAMRVFKKKYDQNPHLFYFTELVLYHPFRDENELFPEDPEKCEELYMKHQDEIKMVKAKVMPFLESVEEAQLIYEEMKADERRQREEQMGVKNHPSEARSE